MLLILSKRTIYTGFATFLLTLVILGGIHQNLSAKNTKSAQEDRRVLTLQLFDQPEPQRKTEKQKNLAFAKTHKTGSSTLQNILLRFGVRNSLNFAFPPDSWIFKLDKPLNSSHVLQGPWKALGEFNIFAAHSRWDYKEVRKIVPQNSTFITLLRDPVECFESNYVYMGLQEHVFKKDIDEFALTWAALEKPRRKKAHIGKNQLLWDLGMSEEDWDEVEKVEEFVDKADKEFELVLITELFDESLVLMQDLLGWSDEDVNYVSQNQRRKSFVNSMKPMTKAILKRWLWADYVLYEHFKQKLEEAIDDYGREKMRGKVQILRQKNESLRSKCVDKNQSKNKSVEKPSGKKTSILDKIETFQVRKNSGPECENVIKRETDFVKEIRDNQTKRAKELQMK